MKAQHSSFTQSVSQSDAAQRQWWNLRTWHGIAAVALVSLALLVAVLLTQSPAAGGETQGVTAPAQSVTNSAYNGSAYAEYIATRPAPAVARPEMAIIGTGSVYDERLLNRTRPAATATPFSLGIDAPAGANLDELPGGLTDYVRGR